MDLYYPTLTFVGSRALGTNSMIVGFGASNSTVFPSLFASGQRGSVGLLLRPSLLPLIQLKSGTSPHFPIATAAGPVTRYGDYFGSAVDPTNSSVTWMAGEFMQAPPSPAIWSTVLNAISSTTGNGTFSSGIKNITSAPGNIGGSLPSTAPNVTQTPSANNLTGQVCADGSLPDVNGVCPDGNPPPVLGAPNVSQPGVPGQVCADGSLPDVNGVCPDGNPPPALGAANVSQPGVPGQVCADGSLPDVNGLCPDGNPPPALGAANVSQPGVPGQVCADGSLPDVNGLCPDGNPPPALGAANVSQPGVPGQVCADGSLPDVNGLCPDGNPPPAQVLQM